MAVEKHKARLAAELTRARLKRRFASLEQLRVQVNNGGALGQAESRQNKEEVRNDNSIVRHNWPQLRWVRVNIVKTTMEEQLKTTFAGYKIVQSLDELRIKGDLQTDCKLIHVDRHIPNLLALPPATDIGKTRGYLDGLIIMQDKASCFPAYLLDPDPYDGCLDACAAPGNKTTHLAAILHEKGGEYLRHGPLIHASERDPKRASILNTMLAKAGATIFVRVHRQDFLKFVPAEPLCSSVGALLLDPSCSGSGIVGRDEAFEVTFPRTHMVPQSDARPRKKKRKRTSLEPSVENQTANIAEELPSPEAEPAEILQARLAALSDFQLRLLLHGFHFPKAHKFTYSTCSIYAEENENVVVKALLHSHKEKLGWRMLRRDEQVRGLQTWDLRGDFEACHKLLSGSALDAKEIAEACIRCEKGTKEGTQGFFVAAFVRDVDLNGAVAEDVEAWEGFDD